MIDAGAIRVTTWLGVLPPCMGGWCTERDTCARYWDRSLRSPAERLCAPSDNDQHLQLPIPHRIIESPAQ